MSFFREIKEINDLYSEISFSLEKLYNICESLLEFDNDCHLVGYAGNVRLHLEVFCYKLSKFMLHSFTDEQIKQMRSQ